MSETTMHETTVVENARLELLRLAAMLEDMGRGCEHWPVWFPLFECEADGGPGSGYKNDREDIIVALREAVALGQLESCALHESADPLDRYIANLRGGREWMVRLTPAGYDWIRAHDAIGEAAQELAAAARGENQR